VRADPEPHDDVRFFAETHGTIASPDASREDRLPLVNLLEVEAWMMRVFGEELI